MRRFVPKLRFIVMSDIHTKEDKNCKELQRLKKGLTEAYEYADRCEYSRIDAFVAVGDFINSGKEEEMYNFKEVLDEYIRPETEKIISLASHEYGGKAVGEELAKQRYTKIFNMPYDTHKVINGFHFIAVSTTNGCNFEKPQIEFAEQALKEAAADSATAPIFFFQHPHITDTVSGSIYWGDEKFFPVLMNYPQSIDFSGHSHVPVNDPRSIWQEYFTALGTGSLSYFELDEFDKYYGTVPPDSEKCAQFLIVEADENDRVRIMPYDIISGNFFPYTWKIDTPSEPDTFLYTDKRYKTAVKPHFNKDTVLECENTENGVKITFGQADISEDYVNDYKVIVRRESDNKIVKQLALWSGYYFSEMPETLSVEINDLPKGKYNAEIFAAGFWNNRSDNSLKLKFEVLSKL